MDFLAPAAKACAVMAVAAGMQLGNLAQACGCVRPWPALPVVEAAEAQLRTALRPEIDSGEATIIGSERTLTLRISDADIFAAGTATPAPRYADLMRRIGEALHHAPGRVQVIGHSDNRPIRTIRFPSNLQLSTARAEAVMQMIAAAAGDASRFTAEGRTDGERHIEVVFQRGAN